MGGEFTRPANCRTSAWEAGEDTPFLRFVRRVSRGCSPFLPGTVLRARFSRPGSVACFGRIGDGRRTRGSACRQVFSAAHHGAGHPLGWCGGQTVAAGGGVDSCGHCHAIGVVRPMYGR